MDFSLLLTTSLSFFYLCKVMVGALNPLCFIFYIDFVHWRMFLFCIAPPIFIALSTIATAINVTLFSTLKAIAKSKGNLIAILIRSNNFRKFNQVKDDNE